MKQISKKPVITKEHGSWAVLFIPLITGITASDSLSFELLPFILSIFFLFMSYTPAETILLNFIRKLPRNHRLKNISFWFIAYFSISIASGSVLILTSGKYYLLLFAAAAVLLFMINLWIVLTKKKNVFSDFIAMAGLTLSAPAVIYLLENEINQKSLLIWLLNMLFFGSGAVYVHMKMKISSLKKKEFTFEEKISLGKLNLAYHAVAVSLIILFINQYASSQLILLAYLPIVIHAVIGTFKFPQRTSFKKIGITFLAYSVIFAFLLSLAGM